MNTILAAGDSIIITLLTYMPAFCKNINPKLFLKNLNNKLYQPVADAKKDDTFNYLFVMENKDSMQLITISSDIINALPDQRVLSFPFKSLETKIIHHRQYNPEK